MTAAKAAEEIKVDLPQTTSDDRSDGINLPRAPHLRLIRELEVLRQCYREVHAIQDRVFELSATAKMNTVEWTKLKSDARLAVIRTRRHRTQAMRTFREVHEYLRRGMYQDPDTKARAEGLTQTASLLFDKLHRENF